MAFLTNPKTITMRVKQVIIMMIDGPKVRMVIAITNQKGGCAKTTTAVNLATALAQGNQKDGFSPSKVLLIDLDPQGNASTSFGIDKSTLNRTVYDLLMNDLGEELPIIEEFDRIQVSHSVTNRGKLKSTPTLQRRPVGDGHAVSSALRTRSEECI